MARKWIMNLLCDEGKVDSNAGKDSTYVILQQRISDCNYDKTYYSTRTQEEVKRK